MQILNEITRYGKLLTTIVVFFYYLYIRIKNKKLNSFIDQLPKNYVPVTMIGLYFLFLTFYRIIKIFFTKSKFRKIFKSSTKKILIFFFQKIKISNLNSEYIFKPNTWTWDIIEFPLILGFLKMMTRRKITKIQRNVVLNIIFHRLIKRLLLGKLHLLIKSDLTKIAMEIVLFYFFSFYFIIRYLKLKCLRYFVREKRIYHLLFAIEISIFSIELSSSLIEFFIQYLQEKHFKKNWDYADEASFGTKIVAAILFSNRFRILNGNFARKKKMLFALFLINKLSRCQNLFGKFFIDFRSFTNSRDNIYNTLHDPTQEDIEKQVEKICVVCREKQETPNFSKKLECSHIVHSKCIQTWLICHKGCPACTWPIVFYDNDFEEFFQKTKSNEFNLDNPFLNIFGVVLGFGKKISINNHQQKKKINSFSLPSLFPETTDLLLWNFIECKKRRLKDKYKSFRFLLKKTLKKRPHGLQIFHHSFKEYFQIRWVEEKFLDAKTLSEKNGFVNDSIFCKKKNFFNTVVLKKRFFKIKIKNL